MTVRFRATVYRTIGSATATNHDGETYVNPDFPNGSIVAEDKKGNWYRLRSSATFLAGDTWPKMLYRDYWKHIAAGPDSPYGASIRNVPKVCITE